MCHSAKLVKCVLSISTGNEDGAFSYYISVNKCIYLKIKLEKDRFVRYPPARCSLSKVAGSPGSAAVTPLRGFFSLPSISFSSGCLGLFTWRFKL